MKKKTFFFKITAAIVIVTTLSSQMNLGEKNFAEVQAIYPNTSMYKYGQKLESVTVKKNLC